MGFKHLKFPQNSLFLVTGGAGFIGSNLCEAILSLGYRVRCLDDLSTGKQANVDMFLDNPGYEFIKGDIKDLDTCMKVCEAVDYVLHQAAWGSVPRSIEMPLFYSLNNIQGTLNMLEAAPPERHTLQEPSPTPDKHNGSPWSNASAARPQSP